MLVAISAGAAQRAGAANHAHTHTDTHTGAAQGTGAANHAPTHADPTSAESVQVGTW